MSFLSSFTHKSILPLLAVLLAAAFPACAQVVPAINEPHGIPISGNLHYDLRYSQTAEFSKSQGDHQMADVSGDASYSSLSKRHPFSMNYGGGYSWNITGANNGGIFQHLSVSQGLTGRTWNLNASENVSYTFQTPTGGFSGVPGVGDLNGTTGTTTPTVQSIIALNTRVLDNATSLQFGHRIDHATSLNIGGSLSQLHFIDNNGESMNTMMVNGGLTRRLDARNSLSGNYSFTRFSYGNSGSPITIILYDNSGTPIGYITFPPLSYGQVSSAQLGLSRRWGKKIQTNFSVGPQWVSSSNSFLEPSSTNVSASASISDTFRLGSGGASYSHGAIGGSGYSLGATEDNANLNFSRELGKKINFGLTASYMRTAGLSYTTGQGNSNGPNNTNLTNAKTLSAQAGRGLGKRFNLFANYSLINQSTTLPTNGNILSGTYQVIAFGIGYSPRETHLRY